MGCRLDIYSTFLPIFKLCWSASDLLDVSVELGRVRWLPDSPTRALQLAGELFSGQLGPLQQGDPVIPQGVSKGDVQWIV